MSRQFNTDGLMVFPSDNGKPITLNAFESIEYTIAFDVRDWSEDRRSAWVYAIVFGCDDEDLWNKTAKKFGWDEEDRKRANMMHEQWVRAKEAKEQLELVRCSECKYGKDCIPPCEDRYCIFYDERHDGNWFCADGKRRDGEND